MKNILVFLVGAAVGSFVTYKLIKTGTEAYIQDEIDSVKSAYDRMYEVKNDDIEKKAYEKAETDIYNQIASYYKANEDEVEKPLRETPKTTTTDVERPYVINPDEFGELDYDLIDLTYYKDGVLADDQFEKVEDVDDVVGLDSLSKIGEYEDDILHVRNDRLKADYEISLDPRTYQDVIDSLPYTINH